MAETERPAAAPVAADPAAAPPAPADPAAAAAPPAPADDGALEEEYYPATVQGVAPGAVLKWGDLTLTVEATLPGPWLAAHDESGRNVLVRMQEAPHWAELPPHRLMPRPLLVCPEGYVLPRIDGSPFGFARPLAEAMPGLLALAQLVRFFQAQGMALVDLDPEQLIATDDGLRLRIPPRLVPVGQPLPAIYREGLTAPELTDGGPATGKEGVYLLGALLYQAATGHLLPEPGFTRLAAMAVTQAGVPQLLAQSLAPAPGRMSPQEFMEGLRALVPPVDPVLRVGVASTVGLNPERPVNEDSAGYVAHNLATFGGRAQLLRVCVSDGMGGMEAGEVASRAAVEAFLAGVPGHPLDAPAAQAEWATELVWQANRAVVGALAGRDGGCTFTGAVFVGARFAIGHVGDTRGYQVTAAGVSQITRDHSLVAALVANGLLTPEQAEVSPDRNKVLRSLGSLRQPQPNYVDDLTAVTGSLTRELAPGEAILLVSDGVWGEVPFPELQQLALANRLDPQRAADALVEAALRAGAPDNATAAVVLRER